MNEKLFYGIITAVCILGVLSVIALTAYTFHLYHNASIISYIASRR